MTFPHEFSMLAGKFLFSMLAGKFLWIDNPDQL